MLHAVANIRLFIQKVQDKICVCCVPFLTIYVIVGASIAALLSSIVCMQLVAIVSSRGSGGGWISAFTGEWSATAATLLLTIQHFYYCEVRRQVRYCCCQVVMKCRHQATTMTCWSSNRQLLSAKLKERKTGLSLGKKTNKSNFATHARRTLEQSEQILVRGSDAESKLRTMRQSQQGMQRCRPLIVRQLTLLGHLPANRQHP